MTRRPTPLRALARFALAAGACAAAAALWAGNRPEQGLLLDAQTWQDEVVTASTGPWPENGWYRLVVQDQGVDVRAVKPGERGMQPADALFFRMKETEKVVALPLSSRCSRLTRPLLICLLLVMIVVGYLNWKQITAGIQLVVEFWITNPFYG